jgi:hypothetical protein
MFALSRSSRDNHRKELGNAIPADQTAPESASHVELMRAASSAATGDDHSGGDRITQKSDIGGAAPRRSHPHEDRILMVALSGRFLFYAELQCLRHCFDFFFFSDRSVGSLWVLLAVCAASRRRWLLPSFVLSKL